MYEIAFQNTGILNNFNNPKQNHIFKVNFKKIKNR